MRRFLVSQARGGGDALALAADLSKQFQTHLTPWAAVAAELPVEPAVDGQAGSALSVGGASAAGRAFCFLPLPVSTGLPVAINGYFELSSNRRDIWHGDDMSGAGAARARWNEALLKLVAAPAYVALLQAATHELGPGAAYGSLWPAGDVPAPWQIVLTEMYRLAARRQLVWSQREGSPKRWMLPVDCIFPVKTVQQQPAAKLQQQPATNVQERAGSQQQQGQSAGQGEGGTEAAGGEAQHEHLHEGMLALGIPLPDLPAAVTEAMERHMVGGVWQGGDWGPG